MGGVALAEDAKNPPYRIGPEPAWVEPLPLPERKDPPLSQISDGIFYLLTEEQIRVEPRESYGQYARRILDETGVQNGSEIQIGVDPSYETLTLHKVEVLRDGAWQQRLSPDIISVLQRETDMERFMLDGRYTVVIRLADIRPSDVIRYSFTRAGANPVMAGHFHTSFSTGWGQPCAQMRQRIWAPEGRPLFFKNHNTELKPKVTARDGGKLYEWEASDMPAIIAEEGVPYWDEFYPWIEASDMDRWQQVVDWALPLYDFDQPLPGDLETEIAAIKSLGSDEEKILRALRLVQDDIRYFGTETGEHSHRPRPPAEVFRMRFGDCKEKTLLFGTILRRLGFPAWPVLVNSDWGRGIEAFLPSPMDFDHVILKTSLGVRDFFLDPTRNHQRGPLASLAVGDFGFGLVVRPGETGLSPIRPTEESLPRSEVEELVEIPDTTNDQPATFKVHTIMRGESAEDARERFATSSRDEIQEKYKRFYADTYSGIEVAKPIRYADNRKDNVFEIWEEYRIPDLWAEGSSGGRVEASFYPQEITSYLKKPAVSGRRSPYEIPHPVNVRQKTTIKLPEAWSVKPSSFRESNKFFDVSYDVARDGETAAVISASFQSRADHVPGAALKEYRTRSEKTLDALGYSFTYTKASGAPAKETTVLAIWPMFCAAIFGFSAAFVMALAIWWLDRHTPPPLLMHPPAPGLDGLGGWLVLVAIGLFLRPFIAAAGLFGLFSPYVTNPQIWAFFTSPSGQYYSPAWLPIFLFETAFNSALIVFSLLLCVLFLGKRKVFPAVYIGVLAVVLAGVVLDAALIAAVPKDNLTAEMRTAMDSGAKDIVRNLIAAIIWIPYMLVSRRVKATFRR